MIPVPCARVRIKSADVESHPPAAVAHVLFESSTLSCGRSIIEEDYDLVVGKICRIEQTPVISRLIGEVVLCGELLKPGVCFLYEVYVGGIPGAVIEGKYFEPGLCEYTSGKKAKDTH